VLLLRVLRLSSIDSLAHPLLQAIRVQAQAPVNLICSAPFRDLRRSPP
jgi:hypothetical protein